MDDRQDFSVEGRFYDDVLSSDVKWRIDFEVRGGLVVALDLEFEFGAGMRSIAIEQRLTDPCSLALARAFAAEIARTALARHQARLAQPWLQ
jgi:hypothetical protein